jgi:RND family efflux transporter MFP subunit
MKTNTKRILYILLGLFIFLIAYILYKNKKEINEQSNAVAKIDLAIPVKVAVVENKNISKSLNATGEFKGWQEVTLVAESQGSIEYIRFEEGDAIKKGQILAKVDAVSLNSQLQTANASLSKAQKDVERYERLEKVGAASKTQLEDIRIQLENAKASISQINQQLSFSVIKSPISGFVNDIMVEETSFVMPGNEIAEIIQIDKLKIIVNVSEGDLSRIKEGQEVTVKTDVYPLESYKGKVNNISFKADVSKKFKVTIEISNTKDNKLRAGMFAQVLFDKIPSQNQTALVVPRESIVGSLQNASVYVVENNIALFRKIEAGVSVDKNVEVLSGLKEGETVITSGIINLKDKAEVKVVKQ